MKKKDRNASHVNWIWGRTEQFFAKLPTGSIVLDTQRSLCQSGYLVVTVFKEYPRLCEHSAHLYNPIMVSGWRKQSVNTYMEKMLLNIFRLLVLLPLTEAQPSLLSFVFCFPLTYYCFVWEDTGRPMSSVLMFCYAENHLASILSQCFCRKCSQNLQSWYKR